MTVPQRAYVLLMQLAIPSLVVWLTGFYALFHCVLNIVAELLRFADRYAKNLPKRRCYTSH
jgi:diacylglycerol O-acyltransferase-1